MQKHKGKKHTILSSNSAINLLCLVTALRRPSAVYIFCFFVCQRERERERIILALPTSQGYGKNQKRYYRMNLGKVKCFADVRHLSISISNIIINIIIASSYRHHNHLWFGLMVLTC